MTRRQLFRHNFAKFGLTLVAALFRVTFLQASSITWSSPTTITGDTDVSTTGSLVAAFNFGYSPTTVNGVTFSTFLPSMEDPFPFYPSLANGNFLLTCGPGRVAAGSSRY